MKFTEAQILETDGSDDVHQSFALAVAELMGVLICPTHGLLDRIAALFESECGWHHESAPDLGLDAVEEDLELDAVRFG